MKGITFHGICLILASMFFSATAMAFPGEELDHECLNTTDNLQRILFREACHTLALNSGYRAGVFRPCDQGNIRCGLAPLCPEPQMNYVCVGYAAIEGDCAQDSDCKTRQYCSKQPGDCTGRGVCRLIADKGECPAIYDPVCGCDNITYSNSCEAESSGTNIQYIGACN